MLYEVLPFLSLIRKHFFGDFLSREEVFFS
jgi:hypothetical protein